MTDVAETLRTHFGREAPAGLSSAYLFGSQAAGRAHRESDVDVAVLLDRRRFPDAATRFDLKVRLTSELIHALRANDVNLVVLNDAPPELGRRIVVEGHRVHLADPEADHAYRRDVQLRAADLDPYLRRMRRIKLETLRR